MLFLKFAVSHISLIHGLKNIFCCRKIHNIFNINRITKCFSRLLRRRCNVCHLFILAITMACALTLDVIFFRFLCNHRLARNSTFKAPWSSSWELRSELEWDERQLLEHIEFIKRLNFTSTVFLNHEEGNKAKVRRMFSNIFRKTSLDTQMFINSSETRSSRRNWIKSSNSELVEFKSRKNIARAINRHNTETFQSSQSPPSQDYCPEVPPTLSKYDFTTA